MRLADRVVTSDTLPHLASHLEVVVDTAAPDAPRTTSRVPRTKTAGRQQGITHGLLRPVRTSSTARSSIGTIVAGTTAI